MPADARPPLGQLPGQPASSTRGGPWRSTGVHGAPGRRRVGAAPEPRRPRLGLRAARRGATAAERRNAAAARLTDCPQPARKGKQPAPRGEVVRAACGCSRTLSWTRTPETLRSAAMSGALKPAVSGARRMCGELRGSHGETSSALPVDDARAGDWPAQTHSLLEGAKASEARHVAGLRAEEGVQWSLRGAGDPAAPRAETAGRTALGPTKSVRSVLPILRDAETADRAESQARLLGLSVESR